MPLDAEQRRQRADAAFGVIVHAHREVDVFDRRDEKERPENQRGRAEHCSRVWMWPGVVEHGFERIKRTRADIAEHHAKRRLGSEGEGSVRLRRDTGSLARHFALPACPRLCLSHCLAH
jgi:hypothetical protein